MVTGWLDVSGTETFMMNVLRHIDREKFQIDFLLSYKKDTRYSREAEALGSKLYYTTPRRNGLIKSLRSVSGFFSTIGKSYDVVHYCGGSLTSISCMYYAHKYGVKNIIAHAHSTSNDGIHNYILHRINKRLFQHLFTYRWACSNEAAQYFFGNRESTIIHNGVDIDKFKYDEEERINTRQALNIAKDDIVLGHIGRFVPLKNQAFVVDVFKEFVEIHPKSKLLLVGVGPEVRTVKSKVEKLNLADKVIFTGERADIPQLLWTMDCFVMPSVYEGLPFVLVEAQTAGVRCLVSDTVSADSKITKILKFKSLNASSIEWAEDIDKMVSEPNNRDSFAEVRENGFDISSTVRFIETIYASKISS